MTPHDFVFTVEAIRNLTPTVLELALKADRPFEFKAGQFMSVVIPPGLRRAYSFASAPEDRFIRLCIKSIEEGPGSGYLCSLKVGDQFRAFAPYGDFIFEAKARKNACFVCTGTGIAPFRAMVGSAAFLAHKPAKTWVLLGVRREEEILYQELFEDIGGVEFVTAVSQPGSVWTGYCGRVTDYMRQAAMPYAETEFYLCGNGPMIKEMKAFLAEKGVEKDAIHSEAYYR